LHVYSGVIVKKDGSKTCFIPQAEMPNLKQTIPLSAYGNPTVGASTTVDVTLPDLSATGYAYINLHLDYGLKRTSNWSATTDGTGGAINSGLPTTIGNTTVTLPPGMTIAYNQPYTFLDNVVAGSGQTTGDPTVYSENEFKKIAGFMGQITDPVSQGIAGINVEIKDDLGGLVGTATTDADGFYLLVYKYTGKGTNWTVNVPVQAGSVTTGVTVSKFVKANSSILTNFQITAGVASVAP